MKNARIITAVLLILSSLLVLCACGFEFSGDSTWEYSADDKEGTVQLYNDFFEKTFANTNQIATMTNADGKTVFVENIDGTSDFVDYVSNGTQTYSFIKDGEYIYALTSEDSSYYTTGEEYYGYGYFAYRNNFDIFDMLPEEGLTYKCEVKGSSTDGVSTATISITVQNEEGTLTINASAKDDLVENITYTRNEGDTSASAGISIVYGSASVTVPDISGWSKQEF